MADPAHVNPTLRLPGRAPGSRRLIIVAVLVMLGLAVITGAGYWLGHASLLRGYGDGMGAPTPIGRTIAFDTAVVSDRDAIRVSLKSLKPRVTENSSDATIVFVVCRRNAGTTTLGVSRTSDLRKYCTRTDPLRRSFVGSLGYTTNQILVLVTPRKSGRVHITGYNATYRVGIRSGTQHVGLDTTVTTPLHR